MSSVYKILVVEDNPVNLAILCKSLEKAGHTVVSAMDGESAIPLAAKEMPDVILLDMILPGIGGLEVCETLKSQRSTASIPIIFVTAVSSAEGTLKAFAAGGSDYVTKPFRTTEVLARVDVQARLRHAEESLLEKNRQTESLARDLAEANVLLAKQSRTDPLTELLNRRAWSEIADVEHDRFERHDTPYSIILLDVDHFKNFNDSLGHQAGDDCLRRLAKSIMDTCRTVDVVGRYGGEEFVVLASETDSNAAIRLAERIRQAVWALAINHPASSVSERVTASLGVAAASGSIDDTLRRADNALYIAKRAGRNMVFEGSQCADDYSTDAPASTREIIECTTARSAPSSVLIVDDDASDRALFRAHLGGEDYAFHEASSGREALDMVSEKAPSAIIMDMLMPDMDGLECIARLRDNPETRDIPIIMVSAKSDEADVIAGLAAGADDYLCKPVLADELALRVSSMVRRFHDRKDLASSYSARGEQTRILQCLLDASREIAAANTMDEILKHTLAITAEATRCRRVSVMLPDKAARCLKVAASIGIDEEVANRIEVPFGGMIAGQVFETGRPVVANTETDEADTKKRYHSSFYVCVPLALAATGVAGRVLGVLNVTDRSDGRPFQPHELEYITMIARVAGSAMHALSSHAHGGSTDLVEQTADPTQ